MQFRANLHRAYSMHFSCQCEDVGACIHLVRSAGRKGWLQKQIQDLPCLCNQSMAMPTIPIRSFMALLHFFPIASLFYQTSSCSLIPKKLYFFLHLSLFLCTPSLRESRKSRCSTCLSPHSPSMALLDVVNCICSYSLSFSTASLKESHLLLFKGPGCSQLAPCITHLGLRQPAVPTAPSLLPSSLEISIATAELRHL